MAVPAHLLKESSASGPLGSLALSQVRPAASTMVLRAVKWHQGLERLGVMLPFFLVHDVGMLFAAPKEQYEVGTRVPAAALGARVRDSERLQGGYRKLLDELGLSEAVRRAPDLKMSDDLVVVVLSRLLGSVAARVGVAPAYKAAVPVDASL
ncbi:MAG: hypothetical protein R3F14_47280, partial [Polyangiaceae bacterium]